MKLLRLSLVAFLIWFPLITLGNPQSIRANSVALVADTLAQNIQKIDTARDVIYFELLGNSFTGCPNYERMIGKSFSVRFGVLLSATAMINYFIGSGSHKLELGAGVTYYEDLGATVTVGYRYQPLDGGFVFKAAFTPLTGTLSGSGFDGKSINFQGFHPWIGISFGHCF